MMSSFKYVLKILKVYKNTSPKQQAAISDHTIIIISAVWLFSTVSIISISQGNLNQLLLYTGGSMSFILVSLIACLYITKFAK